MGVFTAKRISYMAIFIALYLATILLFSIKLASLSIEQDQNTPILKTVTIALKDNTTKEDVSNVHGKAGSSNNETNIVSGNKMNSTQAAAGVKDEKAQDASDRRFDHIAVALKTGKAVALQRAPIQLLTFLAPVKNLMIIGEAPGVVIGAHKMVDVYTGLYKSLGTDDPIAEEMKKADAQEQSVKPDTKPLGDALVPDESSIGWKADAHKNLPGFRELIRKFPDASWYTMIDDDTYMFMDNLNEFLKDYDPLKPYYFGKANAFTGCDGVKDPEHKPLFAHGGSGIVISRGAMLKMMSGVETCMIDYKNCWAGDIRTALCLQDHNITIIDSYLFNTHPPNKKYSFTDSPCTRPITFHHLLVHQMQRLAILEQRKKSQGLPVRLEDIFQDWIQLGIQFELNTDRPGSDMINYDATSASDCLDQCLSNIECASYTFDGRQCWLKRGVPEAKKNTDSISGVIASHFKCILD